jgi:hypothetical protein
MKIKTIINNTINNKYFVLIFIAIFFLISYNLFLPEKQGEQQFTFLANSFIHGKLYFINYLQNTFSAYDTALFQGNYYWPLGPGPALVLIPFVYFFNLFGVFFYQGYLNIIFALIICFLIFRISLKFKYSVLDSLYLVIAFCFSSVFIGAIALSWGWYLSQSLTVLLLLLIIYEYLNKKRYLLISLLLGLVFITRATAAIAIVFFILDIIINQSNFKVKFSNLLKLFSPFIIIFVFQLIYNYFRFGLVLEQGYSLQILSFPGLARAREYGLFSLIHLPANLYYFLLNLPNPIFRDGISHVLSFPYFKADPWGMSIFITSPWLLYLFGLKYNNRLAKILIITILLIALPIFLYYGIGFRQFGYRYALDFMPWLFILFVLSYRDKYSCLSNKLKLIILISAVVNFYFLLTIF